MDIFALRTGKYRYLNGSSFSTMPFYAEMIGVDNCRPDYSMYREKSPLSVVGYTVRGRGWIEQDGVEEICEPGQFFVLPLGGTHQYRPQPEWEFYWVNVRGDLWGSLLTRYGLSRAVVFDIPAAGESFVKCISDCMDSETSAEEAQRQLQMELFGLLLHMYENHTANAPLLARRIRDALDRCCLSPITKEEICEKVGITVRHAQRVFRAAYGQSLHDYICTKRIEHARDLLRRSNEPLGKIAEMVGISDEKYFITFFKRHTGQTPADFRRLEANGAADKNELCWKK